MNIIRPKATAEKCGVTVITVHRWSTDPQYFHMGFPKKVSLGANSVGFIEDEVDEWIATRAGQRDGGDDAGAA